MGKTGMRKAKAGSSSDMSLAGALLRIVAVGVAGGAALITGAVQVGKMIEKKQTTALNEEASSDIGMNAQIGDTEEGPQDVGNNADLYEQQDKHDDCF